MSTTATVDEFVVSSLIELGAESPVDVAAPLADLGLDSLDLAEFAQLVREAYDVKLEGKDFKEVGNVADVIALVAARKG